MNSGDYGKIPGAGNKDVLFKTGAEKLCEIYGLWPEYEIVKDVDNWDMTPPLFDYLIKCTLKTHGSNMSVGQGLGSCSSHETKYKYRTSGPTCPDCGMELRRSKNADGFYCWQKTGGCGWTGEAQGGGKVANADIADVKNTVLKMACKRAYVAATITAIHASDMFTQDLEDYRVDITDVTPIRPAADPTKVDWDALVTNTPTPPPVEAEVIEEFIEETNPEMGNQGYVSLLKEVRARKLELKELVMILEQNGVTKYNLALKGFDAQNLFLKFILEKYGVSIGAKDGRPHVTGLTLNVFEAVMQAIGG